MICENCGYIEFYKEDEEREIKRMRMKTKLRMKCPSCGHWNSVRVNNS